MKRLVSACVAALAALCLAAPLAAQEWPARQPVKVVVPFGPGSTPDFIARLMADYFQQKFGHTFIVDNRTGAGGNRGTMRWRRPSRTATRSACPLAARLDQFHPVREPAL